MLRKFTAILAGLAFVATANAGDKKSEYWWQPGEGQKAAELSLNSFSAKYDSGVAGAKTTTWTGMPIGIGYKHGLNNDWALGVSTDFGSIEKDTGVTGATKTKDSGMSDLLLNAAGRNDMGSFWMFFGTDFNLALGKHKIDKDGNGDRSLGGMYLAPYVGLLYPVADAFTVGGKFMYQMNMERTDSVNTAGTDVDTKKKGGDIWTLNVNGEYNYGSGFVGLYLGTGAAGETTSTTAGVDTKSKASTISTMGLWASYDFGSEFTGILGYDTWTASTDAGGGVTSKYTPTTISVTGRYNF